VALLPADTRPLEVEESAQPCDMVGLRALVEDVALKAPVAGTDPHVQVNFHFCIRDGPIGDALHRREALSGARVKLASEGLVEIAVVSGDVVIYQHKDVGVVPQGVYRLELTRCLLHLPSDSVEGRIAPRSTDHGTRWGYLELLVEPVVDFIILCRLFQH
jgi:hypothetical protein